MSYMIKNMLTGNPYFECDTIIGAKFTEDKSEAYVFDTIRDAFVEMMRHPLLIAEVVDFETEEIVDTTGCLNETSS